MVKKFITENELVRGLEFNEREMLSKSKAKEYYFKKYGTNTKGTSFKNLPNIGLQDWDRDDIPNFLDCRPLNRWMQDDRYFRKGMEYNKNEYDLKKVNMKPKEFIQKAESAGIHSPYSLRNQSKYVEAMKKGSKFPMPKLIYNQQGYIIDADGRHRVEAAEKAGLRDGKVPVYELKEKKKNILGG